MKMDATGSNLGEDTNVAGPELVSPTPNLQNWILSRTGCAQLRRNPSVKRHFLGDARALARPTTSKQRLKSTTSLHRCGVYMIFHVADAGPELPGVNQMKRDLRPEVAGVPPMLACIRQSLVGRVQCLRWLVSARTGPARPASLGSLRCGSSRLSPAIRGHGTVSPMLRRSSPCNNGDQQHRCPRAPPVGNKSSSKISDLRNAGAAAELQPGR